MAGIKIAIELQDNLTNILYQVIDSVNLELSAIEDLHQAMNSPIDMVSMDLARESMNRATVAANELVAAMQELGSSASSLSMPAASSVSEKAQWKSSNLEVFTGSGVERFGQEIQSVNTMAEQLSSTQDIIARQAYNTNIFPSSAFQNLNSMAVRIDMVKNRIQQIESNPLNMGTDTANAGVEQLRGQLNRALQEQSNLNQAVKNLDVQSANESYLRLQQIIGGTERYIRDNINEQGQFNQEINQGTEESNQLMQKIKGTISTYANMQTLKDVLNLSDQLTSTVVRLDMINDGLQSTQDLQNMIFLSAERSRGSYQATADTVSKFERMTGNAFSSNEETISFVEQINKQFVIAGTEAAEIDAAMMGLIQAMGTGVLKGEEYTSILTQAPSIIQTIADYLGVPKERLEEMAFEGKITSDIIKGAMFVAADETNAKFENMPKTFGQMWNSFGNHALMAFSPVLKQINEIGNSEEFQGFIDQVVVGLSCMAGITTGIINLMAGAISTLADNWSWISPIIYGVAGALAVYYGWLLLTKGAALVAAGAQAILTAAKMLAVPIYAALTGATMVNAAAQLGLNAAMYACPIVWIIILIIALIAIIYTVVAAFNKLAVASVSATGIICGVIAVAGAFILNTAIGLINAILQGVWSFASPFIGIVEWILNVANGGFDSFGGAVANLIGQIISWFLSLGMVVTKIIDAIFGTDWTSGLSELQSSVLGWGKNEDAITLDRSAPTINYRMGYKDVWDAGNSFGEGIDEKIANFDLTSLFGPSNIPSEEDYINDPLGEGINSIVDNTGKMANSMDITSEELKYLRDIAEQETINRFTTAEIHIDQSGMRNHIKNGTDLDGVVSGLTDAMIEAVDMVAEGVHE